MSPFSSHIVRHQMCSATRFYNLFMIFMINMNQINYVCSHWNLTDSPRNSRIWQKTNNRTPIRKSGLYEIALVSFGLLGSSQNYLGQHIWADQNGNWRYIQTIGISGRHSGSISGRAYSFYWQRDIVIRCCSSSLLIECCILHSNLKL